jgi:hypothetical protein
MRLGTGLPLSVAAGLVLAACVIGANTGALPARPVDRVHLTITSDRVIAPTGSGKADGPLPNDADARHTLRTTASSGNARLDVAGGPRRCEPDHVISGTPPPSHPLYVQKG